jgi:ubiquinone/menaquinone biosynthesis C-methylase UbiE
MPPTQPPPSPVHFFDTLVGYQRTAALRAAIELALFTTIAEGNRSVAAIAKRCAASERGVRILCDYLVITGFLTKSGETYGLTADTAVFLDRKSPSYIGSIAEFIASPPLIEAFLSDPAEIVRRGGTLQGEGSVSPDNPIWVAFARAMAPMVARPAGQLAALADDGADRPIKVLDIAAGHGLFGIEIAKRNRRAEITALDWEPVLEVARENAAAAGVTGRFRTIAGSAFEADFDGPYDVVLLTNFLHHFDSATCEGLLRKVHAALRPGGRAAALEFVPNEDRVTPPGAAAFSFVMLGSTRAGDAYTFAEYRRMFEAAGFSELALHELPPTDERAVTARR